MTWHARQAALSVLDVRVIVGQRHDAPRWVAEMRLQGVGRLTSLDGGTATNTHGSAGA